MLGPAEAAIPHHAMAQFESSFAACWNARIAGGAPTPIRSPDSSPPRSGIRFAVLRSVPPKGAEHVHATSHPPDRPAGLPRAPSLRERRARAGRGPLALSLALLLRRGRRP